MLLLVGLLWAFDARAISESSPPSSKLRTTCLSGKSSFSSQSGVICICSYPLEEINTTEGIGCGIRDCGFGIYSFLNRTCICNANWRKAGPTNPINFVMGRCTQHHCDTDASCAKSLGIDGATCPVVGWNCDCGLWHAGLGNSQSQCMYPWWAFAAEMTRLLELLARYLWVAVVMVAVALLPFGKNIHGSVQTYSFTTLSHDLAWTVFTLKFGLWLYAFAITVYLTVAFMWISVFFVVVAICILCIAAVACLAACAALGEGGGVGCSEFGGCSGCSGVEGCSACTECSQCSEACCFCGASSAHVESPVALYAYEPCCLYYDPFFMGIGQTDSRCCCCCPGCPRPRRLCSFVTMIPWLRILVMTFPRIPENMLGGMLGWALGTHPMRNNYDQNSRTVRLLASPCWSITNGGEQWRRTVYQWLHERDASEATAQAGVTIAEPQNDVGSARIVYGDVVVESDSRPFQASDRMFNSNDYASNSCWICQDSADEWDLWVSCRHVFCARCSGEMLRRRMPCPFCRVRSSRVVRRKAALRDVEAQDQEQEECEQLLLTSAPCRAPTRRGAVAPAPQQVPPSQGQMEWLDRDV